MWHNYKMDLSEFKTQRVNEIIKGNKEWGEIVTFIDFGNVNYWFKDDRNDEDGNLLNETEELSIDLSKLSQFVKSFSSDNRFYYGHDLKIVNL